MLVGEPIDVTFLDTQASHNAVSFVYSQINNNAQILLYVRMHVYNIASGFTVCRW